MVRGVVDETTVIFKFIHWTEWLNFRWINGLVFKEAVVLHQWGVKTNVWFYQRN